VAFIGGYRGRRSAISWCGESRRSAGAGDCSQHRRRQGPAALARAVRDADLVTGSRRIHAQKPRGLRGRQGVSPAQSRRHPSCARESSRTSDAAVVATSGGRSPRGPPAATPRPRSSRGHRRSGVRILCGSTPMIMTSRVPLGRSTGTTAGMPTSSRHARDHASVEPDRSPVVSQMARAGRANPKAAGGSRATPDQRPTLTLRATATPTAPTYKTGGSTSGVALRT
jgi:hypothetical protein